MIKFKNSFIYKLLKYIYQFFLTVYIFDSNIKFRKINKKGKLIFFIKSIKEAEKNSFLKNYFYKNNFKLKRFNEGSKFIGLRNKNEIIVSGWIYFGNKWVIEEVNKEIRLNKRYLLYDFLTEKRFRNKGYYKLLLKTILNKFNKKKFTIYALSNNNKSIRAIEKSGFMFVKKISK